MLNRTNALSTSPANGNPDAAVAPEIESQKTSARVADPRRAQGNWRNKLAMGLLLPWLAVCGYAQTVPARLFVGNTGDGTVSVLDATFFFPVATISLGSTCGPRGIAQTADLQYVYVACQNMRRLAVINTATNSVTQFITLNGYPTNLAMSRKTLLVTITDGVGGGWMSLINTSTQKVAATIQNVGSAPVAVASSPSGKLAYVVSGVSGTVAVVDVINKVVVHTIAVSGNPTDAAVSPDGSKLYVSAGSGAVVISTATNTNIGQIYEMLNQTMGSVLVNPDSSKVYLIESSEPQIDYADAATNMNVSAGYWSNGGIMLAMKRGAVSSDGNSLFVTAQAADTGAGVIIPVDARTEVPLQGAWLPSVGNAPWGILYSPAH